MGGGAAAVRSVGTLVGGDGGDVFGLLAAGAALGDDDSAGSGEQDGGDEAFGFEAEGGLADDLEVRAGVVDDEDAAGIELGKQAANLGFAIGEVAVAEEEVDAAVDDGVE